MNSPSDEPGRMSAPSRVLIIMAVTALAIVTIAWAMGLFDVVTFGKLQAPNVAVTGGKVPSVQVEVADIDVGTKTETIEVPTVSVTKPDDDGSNRK